MVRRLDFAGYVLERRAMRLDVTTRESQITIKPRTPCVNPVFELATPREATLRSALGGNARRRADYAWDGRTLWLDATIDTPTVFE